MTASQKFENSWLKRLHADADAIHAGVAVAEKFVAIDRARVGFKRDFAIGIDRKRGRNPRQKLADAGGLERRRSAPAEENALYGSTPPIIQVSVMFKLPQQSVGIASFGDFRYDMRVKVAVWALADTVRDVDIEREGR